MTDSLLPIIETADTNAAEYITANGVTLACREGCDYCCYLRVTAYPHEASSIVDYIHNNFTENQLDELRGRLKRHVDIVDDMTEDQHQTSNMRYPLLVGSRCSVYPVRPVACRAYTSLDVQSCEYSFKHPSDMKEKRPTDRGLKSLWERERRRIENLGTGAYGQFPHEIGTILLSKLNPSHPRPTS